MTYADSVCLICPLTIEGVILFVIPPFTTPFAVLFSILSFSFGFTNIETMLPNCYCLKGSLFL